MASILLTLAAYLLSYASQQLATVSTCPTGFRELALYLVLSLVGIGCVTFSIVLLSLWLVIVTAQVLYQVAGIVIKAIPHLSRAILYIGKTSIHVLWFVFFIAHLSVYGDFLCTVHTTVSSLSAPLVASSGRTATLVRGALRCVNSLVNIAYRSIKNGVAVGKQVWTLLQDAYTAILQIIVLSRAFYDALRAQKALWSPETNSNSLITSHPTVFHGPLPANDIVTNSNITSPPIGGYTAINIFSAYQYARYPPCPLIATIFVNIGIHNVQVLIHHHDFVEVEIRCARACSDSSSRAEHAAISGPDHRVRACPDFQSRAVRPAICAGVDGDAVPDRASISGAYIADDGDPDRTLCTSESDCTVDISTVTDKAIPTTDAVTIEPIVSNVKWSSLNPDAPPFVLSIAQVLYESKVFDSIVKLPNLASFEIPKPLLCVPQSAASHTTSPTLPAPSQPASETSSSTSTAGEDENDDDDITGTGEAPKRRKAHRSKKKVPTCVRRARKRLREAAERAAQEVVEAVEGLGERAVAALSSFGEHRVF